MAIQQLSSVEELKFAIQQLEIKQANEWPPIKGQLFELTETFKPRHIIRDTFREIITCPTLKANVLSGTLGLVAALSGNFFSPHRPAS